jgi:hypothetical protein
MNPARMQVIRDVAGSKTANAATILSFSTWKRRIWKKRTTILI